MYFDFEKMEIDLHGMNEFEAKRYLDDVINNASKDIKELKVIHGCHGGKVLQNFVRKKYSHSRIGGKIKEFNDGVTTLVLK